MAKGEESKKPQGPPPASVANLPSRCPVESCGKKIVRSSFCTEHFAWFKQGLINRKGEKPKDFDKKHQAYLNRQKKVA